MTDYVQSIDFSAKDALPSGDSGKKILGADVDGELGLISTAIASKLNSNGSAENLTALPAAQGSSLVLLNKTTASAAASVVWNSTYITSTYDVYFSTFTNTTVSTSGVTLYIQVSDDNGSTWKTTNWYSARYGVSVASGPVVSSVVPAGAFNDGGGLVLGSSYDTSYNIQGYAYIYKLNELPYLEAHVVFTGGGSHGNIRGSAYHAVTSFNAIRYVASTGTISGTFALYGLKKA